MKNTATTATDYFAPSNVSEQFVSVDRQTAISSAGQGFRVGEQVAHQDADAGVATILPFEPDEHRNETKVHTNKGYAYLGFLAPQEQPHA